MEQHLAQYRIFFEVAKAGSISKAAKLLYISQPAISKSILRLEENLEIALFTRTSKGVSLTPEGQIFYEYLQNAFSAIEAGEIHLAKIKQFNIGKITIGTSNTLCKYILLPYLNKFMKENPHTMVSIFTQSSDKTSLLLSENKIDIGLVAKPAKTQSMSYINIMEIHDIFVATPAYLSSLKHIFDKGFNPLRDGNIMLLDKNNATRRFIDNCIEGSKLHLNQSIETGNMELLIEFAKTGIGIACVIKEFIQKELEEGTLVEIEMPPDLYIPKREIVFLYDEKNFNPSLIKFISMLKK
ncbi:transcriptional regulator, LysR family [Lachnoanaerobaculum saburreum F0468]|uniref:Transcriptional regulator, LysR family n=1 Tax=Lachnoanaerobaculum saburreum F0468 TaxID=1095750 RepID=I0R5W8_9FIRM|nr:LysR family transcriptional regulator [Lachnoanaerobaculum saburreum]EIC95076.1 transcriptional regulator, LysR family [Lachnoanaerobaculum saburreum F0468]RKW57883.1 MAG: LysR family transcriptional regulator [Lachnospiraceae bacterium]